jgi:hypothetical protein
MIEEKREAIDTAMEFDFAHFGWGEPTAEEMERLQIDADYSSDFRNLLIEFRSIESDEDLIQFLHTCDSPRYLDLRRAYEALRFFDMPKPGYAPSEDYRGYFPNKEVLTDLAMKHSLCPIHFVDWAICFDDEDPECEQVRTIFPNNHDT